MSLSIKAARAASVGFPVEEGGLFGAIGGALKRGARALLPTAASLIPGGNMALSAASAVFGAGPKPPSPVAFAAPPPPTITGGPGQPPAMTISPRSNGMPTAPRAPRGSGLALPSFSGGVSKTRGGHMKGSAGAGGGIACQSGFHPNKSDYYAGGVFVPKGTRCVKNRRRNPLNPRALKRAVSRVDAGKVWQAKLREIETGKYTKAGNKK